MDAQDGIVLVIPIVRDGGVGRNKVGVAPDIFVDDLPPLERERMVDRNLVDFFSHGSNRRSVESRRHACSREPTGRGQFRCLAVGG